MQSIMGKQAEYLKIRIRAYNCQIGKYLENYTLCHI